MSEAAEIARIDENAIIPVDELMEICAADSEFYSRHFFPRTVRAPSPKWDAEVWDVLESPLKRLKNLVIFRDGAKTTRGRLFTSKRIAFGISHLVFYCSKSEGHAIRSLDWLRRQVEYNKKWAQTFRLRPGKKWGGEEIEIIHEAAGFSIWLVASGITGSVRGINRDDFRPDTILLDDILDDENCNTPEAVKKLERLVHGAIKNSLADPVEFPDAVMAMLNTPQAKEDPCQTALGDEEWMSYVIGCWTKETEHLPVDEQVSSWKERWPTDFMRAQKRAAIKKNRLSTFAREKECRLTSPETSAFKSEWLRYWEVLPERSEMVVSMWIDPVPPPSEKQIAQRMEKKDYEALACVGYHRKSDRYFLLEYKFNRGHDPDWTIAKFFDLCMRWRPRHIKVEGVAYQRTLKWILDTAMRQRRKHFLIDAVDDKRSKYDKIVDGLQGVASDGAFYIHASHIDFKSQFEDYPDVSHDDILESVARAVDVLHTGDALEGDYEELEEDEEDIPALAGWRGAP